jgi:hypothetical protein
MGVDLAAAGRLLSLLFDTKAAPEEAAFEFGGGGELVAGAGLPAGLPGGLYLVCRALLILRGVAGGLGCPELSVVRAWGGRHAAAGLAEHPDVADSRARTNAAIEAAAAAPPVARA